MRHRVAGRHLSRTSSHRLAMRRNIVASLFEHETISTTLPKAKEVRSFAEKLITLAKKGDLAARRRAISLLGNRDILVEKDGRQVKAGTVIGKLFSEIAPRFLDRPGGYTRIIKLAKNRLGDNGQVVLLQLVSEQEKVKKSGKKGGKKAAVKKASEVIEKAAEEKPEDTPAVEKAQETEGVPAEESQPEDEKVEEPNADEAKSEEE